MTQSINELEHDIEETRARLDRTIDQIQGRLSPASIVDEMLGTVRHSPASGLYDGALEAVRRNPVPVMLIVAGIGWLIHRVARESQRRQHLDATMNGAEAVPVLNTGAARVYDPDRPTAHPAADRVADGMRM
ncbi:DUF3618 domain-containing protein [Methylobacterium frigidaeris]|uniref:DUF3618 domain-containing protein n=1 Tax=Methylobacterium frigidaeris TaxID=2038277 RepID=A0AA37HCA1_9HYPH|nr:DUF3618 domain-containing protein [Methylobacterium frigidaeris]PIK68613.1 hypothetical protein CS379_34150 [Methylobacterium frigidaeris]GJD62929.1 hypothetical protein MPEAHAMD_3089 [Methylobacterium frigidaeris]